MNAEYTHLSESNPQAQELWGDERARKQEFDALTHDEFRTALTTVNANSRGLNPDAHTLDGGGVVVAYEQVTGESSLAVEHQPPAAEDKIVLLDYMLDTAQKVPDIQDAALLVGGGINLVHAFKDGNGKTSRYFYSWMSAGPDFIQQHPDILANGSRSMIDIGTEIPNGFLRKIARERLGAEADERAVDAEVVRVFCDAFLDPSIVMTDEDIPTARYKIGPDATITLPNYLMKATFNLAASRPKEVRRFVRFEEDGKTYKRPVVVGYGKDERF